MTRYGTTGRKHHFRVHYYRSRGVVHVGGVVRNEVDADAQPQPHKI